MISKSFSILATAFFVFSGLCAPAEGASSSQAKHLVVSLVTERDHLVPGKTFPLGLKFELESGWHVYWHNPGDSGEPPRVQWSLPQGFSAGPLQFPLPEKITVGPLADYGYSREVLFISNFQTPASLSPTVAIKALVKWLVCREVCIPGKADLDLKLAKGETSRETSEAPLFAATRQNLPADVPGSWQIRASATTTSVDLEIEGPARLTSAYFYPDHPLQIDNPSPQNLSGKTLHIKLSEQITGPLTQLEGLLRIDDKSYKISIPVTSVPFSSSRSVWLMILFAFLGGIILNLMPCVFPVLSIKVFGFLKMGGAEKQKLRLHGLTYALGVLSSFWVLVVVLILLKNGGQKLGWGFQLQSPAFVSALSSVLFLFGLNLMGVFEIGGAFTGLGNSLTRKQGLWGDFFTGVLATLVSTPCTAPFMGTAVGFALSQPPALTFIIFTFLGLGLSFPYVLLAFTPSVGRVLPRPGPWMEIVKQITGFLIFATVIWLLSVVALQTSTSQLVVALGSLFMMSVAAWLLHRWQDRGWAKLASFLIIACGLFIVIKPSPLMGLDESPRKSNTAEKSSGDLSWEDFTPEKVESAVSANKPVFVDFTAAWCISCKVNELLVFGSEDVRRKIKEKNVLLLRADWTNHDEMISNALSRLGRSGVPTYAIYGIGGSKEPYLLPEVITPPQVLKALDQIR